MAQYEIVITNGTTQQSPVQVVPQAQNNSVGGEKDVPVSAGARYAQSLLKKVVGVGVIVHTADQIISQQHSTISLTTGAQEYGQRASYFYQKGSSFIKSVVIGGMAGGQVAGPGGAVAGAAVSALLNIGGQAMNYFLQKDVLDKQKSLEDISIRMRTMRATVSGRRYSNITEY